MDRRLIERTIEIAGRSQTFGPRALRAAKDEQSVVGRWVRRRYVQLGRPRGSRRLCVWWQKGRGGSWSRPRNSSLSALRGIVGTEQPHEPRLVVCSEWMRFQGVSAREEERRQEIPGVMCLLSGNYREFQVIFRCQHKLVCRGECWRVTVPPRLWPSRWRPVLSWVPL
jgi:hypothetical protein